MKNGYQPTEAPKTITPPKARPAYRPKPKEIMLTFEEANTLLRMQCKDIPHGDQLVMGLRAFGCEYAHSICGKCNNRFDCDMQGMRNGRPITKCNYFERG